jgi:hypothetical protein
MFRKGNPPNGVSLFVFHQLWTHAETFPLDLSSAPRLKGMNDKGSLPAIMPSVKSPRDKPSTSEAFIHFPEMWMTCNTNPPSR